MRRVALVLCALLGLAGALGAEEEIHSYDSHVVVGEDGVLEVTETITCTAEGRKIQRGIYRDFPTQYPSTWGLKRKVPFGVLSVQHNGHPAHYVVEDVAGGKRIRIGRGDVFLDHGKHVYAITYRVGGMLGFFEDHDELYWNVTGNGWDFAMGEVTARVSLPEGVNRKAFKLDGYTGPLGAKHKAFKSWIDDSGDARWATTHALGHRCGMTLVLEFPKGHFTPGEERPLLLDNPDLLIALAGLTIITLWFLGFWFVLGRDPDMGLVIPRFEPPSGLTPAEVRHVQRMGFDATCFSAFLLDLAVKGHLKIVESDGTYTLHRLNKDREGLKPFEKKLLGSLFGSASTLVLKNSNHSILSKAQNMLKDHLESVFTGTHFNRNGIILGVGIILWLLTVVGSGLKHPQEVMAPLFFLLGVLGLSTCGVLSGWMHRRRGGPWVGLTVRSLLMLPLVTALVYFLSPYVNPLTLAAILLISLELNVFAHLIKAPTKGGIKVFNWILGFQMYLETGEKDLHGFTNPPPSMTVPLYEKYLPYAMALDVAGPWTAKFNAEVADASAVAQHNPGWYQGSSVSSFRTGNLASHLESSFNSSVASSCIAPSSSGGSGGGGGGSSGGGGGGGGGGGW